MHCYRYAFFLWHHEVEAMLQIVHVPDFDHAIFAARANKIVLVKLIQPRVPRAFSVHWLWLELIWGYIFVVNCLYLVLR